MFKGLRSKAVALILIPLLALSLLSGCVTALDGHEEITPLMWLVTAPNGQTMYLFGSIHVADEELYPLPDVIMDAFNSSDYLAVEVDLFDIKYIYNSIIKYTDDRTIADDIGIELHESIKDIIAKQYPEYDFGYLDEYKPAQWIGWLNHIITEKSGLDDKYGIDLYFNELAIMSSKPVLEIESQLQQMELLYSLSLPLQIAWLEGLLYTDEAALETIELYNVWKQGDELALEMLLSPGFENDDFNDEFINVMLRERDIAMADKAEQYMSEGKNVFFVVGAMHLVGKGGIVDLLIQRGYDVELIKYPASTALNY